MSGLRTVRAQSTGSCVLPGVFWLTGTQGEKGLEPPGLDREGTKEKTLALNSIWVNQQERTELEAGGTSFSEGGKQTPRSTEIRSCYLCHARARVVIILIPLNCYPGRSLAAGVAVNSALQGNGTRKCPPGRERELRSPPVRGHLRRGVPPLTLLHHDMAL